MIDIRLEEIDSRWFGAALHDGALVAGYRGSRKTPDLLAKLERLRSERQGFVEESMIETAGPLKVVPVEWAIARAAKDGVKGDRQLDLW